MNRREAISRILRIAGAGLAVAMVGTGQDHESARAADLAIQGKREECGLVEAVVREGEMPGYHRHECVWECILYDADGKPIAASMEPAPGRCER